jgi:hypothetical protein
MPSEPCVWDEVRPTHDTVPSGEPDDEEFQKLKEIDELLKALPVPRLPDDLDDPWI